MESMVDGLTTFRGKSMADALDQVKRRFGRTAVILSTRTVSRRGVLGLGARPYVEITAAREMNDLPEPMRKNGMPVRSPRAPISLRGRGAGGEGEGPDGSFPGRSGQAPKVSPDALLSEVSSLKGLIGELVVETRRARTPSIPAELFDFHRRLIETNVAEELAGQLLSAVRTKLTAQQMGDPKAVRAELARAMMAMLPPTVPIEVRGSKKPYVVALVGPTGVGKTTTIAKLAANLCLRENRRVGLLTLDTYRIAAVEQLKTYARIIDVPLEVVLTPDQLPQAVAAMADRDVVFFDTAGRSQRDGLKIKDLQRFFAAVKPNEIHLVLSATADQRVLDEAIARFSDVGFDHVIFTKLDEAVGFGVVLNCLQKVKTRLSYVTTGQDVPDDIRLAEHRLVTELILDPPHGGESLGPARK